MFREKTGGRSRRDSQSPSHSPPHPIDRNLTEKEKEDLLDQAEEFEGPDRREIRGKRPVDPEDPGVASS
jgi:hypothetical protein